MSLEGPPPAGLELVSPAPGHALLRGAPTAAGTSRLTLLATNTVGNARHAVTLVVDPKPVLSRSTVTVPLGHAFRRVVRVRTPGVLAVRCLGRLPEGVRCRAAGERTVAIQGWGMVRRAGTYRLTVRIEGRGGTVTRSLLVRLGPTRE